MSSTSRNLATELPVSDTRRRLLEVAGEEFATLGYRNATIREICRKADANIAAINYHFGDKAQLYSEVLRYYSIESLQKYPPNLGVTEGSSPEEKLYAFVRSFFLRITDRGRPSWYGKLIAREMMDPTHALEERARESMKPTFELLLEVVRQIAPRLSEDQLRISAMSIVGQINFHHNCRPAIEKIYPEQTYEPEDVERLARHVTDFSLAGLSELNARAQ
jgi:AcrR family transcriptional regulator